MSEQGTAILLLETTDAREWAREFMRMQREHGPFDEATMVTWFSNAIATGWDQALRRAEPEHREQVERLERLLYGS